MISKFQLNPEHPYVRLTSKTKFTRTEILLPSVLLLMGFTFLNLFGLLECLVMWLISMLVIKVYLPNFSNRVIGVINFERCSPNFIADTKNWFLNSVLD